MILVYVIWIVKILYNSENAKRFNIYKYGECANNSDDNDNNIFNNNVVIIIMIQ